MAIDNLNKLAKWRMVLAGWIGGTAAMNAGGVRGLRDLQDKFLMAQVQSRTIADLLIRKGVFTEEEFNDQQQIEAGLLDKAYEEMFDGMRTTETGVEIFHVERCAEMMERLGFPP